MEKKKEDYLHLYLGCDVLIDNAVIGRLVGFEQTHKNEFRPVVLPYSAEFGGRKVVNDPYLIKPILQPLTSLTFEEDQVIFPANNRGHKIDMHWYPEGFAWLLKNQFDLFGLIDAGLAISKVEVSNPLKNVE